MASPLAYLRFLVAFLASLPCGSLLVGGGAARSSAWTSPHCALTAVRTKIHPALPMARLLPATFANGIQLWRQALVGSPPSVDKTDFSEVDVANFRKMDTEVLYKYGIWLVDMRRYVEAQEVLGHLVQVRVDDGPLWMKLSHVHTRSHDLKQAEATLREAIESCPDNAQLRQALADLCRRQKRFDEAREHFRGAMSIEPQMRSVYDSWGRMESHLGRYAAATSLFKRGLAIKPSARSYHALGVLQDTQGRGNEARETLRAGLRLRDEQANPQLLHALGMLEVRAGNVQRARQSFLSALESSPSFTMAHLSLGQVPPRTLQAPTSPQAAQPPMQTAVNPPPPHLTDHAERILAARGEAWPPQGRPQSLQGWRHLLAARLTQRSSWPSRRRSSVAGVGTDGEDAGEVSNGMGSRRATHSFSCVLLGCEGEGW